MITRLLIIASVVGFMAVFGLLTNLAYPEFSQKQVERVADFGKSISTSINEKQNDISQYSFNTLNNISESVENIVFGVKTTTNNFVDGINQTTNTIARVPSNIGSSIKNGFNNVTETAHNAYIASEEKVMAFFGRELSQQQEVLMI